MPNDGAAKGAPSRGEPQRMSVNMSLCTRTGARHRESPQGVRAQASSRCSDEFRFVVVQHLLKLDVRPDDDVVLREDGFAAAATRKHEIAHEGSSLGGTSMTREKRWDCSNKMCIENVPMPRTSTIDMHKRSGSITDDQAMASSGCWAGYGKPRHVAVKGPGSGT